jgi:hypothetical protein
MTITEQIRKIMLAEELSDAEKLDQLHALIPPDVFKIDSLSTATPAQLRQFERWLSSYPSDATDQAPNNEPAPANAILSQFSEVF